MGKLENFTILAKGLVSVVTTNLRYQSFPFKEVFFINWSSYNTLWWIQCQL